MLLSSISRKGEPYVDDKVERGRECESLGNGGAGRRGTSEDYKDRDDSEWIDEEETSPIP